jgi:hydroxymethylpyrimidine synthase
VQGTLAVELAKLDVAVRAGAHSVMDLSTGRDLMATRRAILDHSPVMVGAVPLYAVAADLVDAGRGIEAMTASMLLDSIEAQCAAGVDYITVHCGVTRQAVARTHAQDRVAGIVSRGGRCWRPGWNATTVKTRCWTNTRGCSTLRCATM